MSQTMQMPTSSPLTMQATPQWQPEGYGGEDGESRTKTLPRTILMDRFEPLLALAMHVRGTKQGQALSCQEVSDSARQLLSSEAAASQPPDILAKDIDDARLAACTFFDEILLSSQHRGDAWLPHSLQLSLYGSCTGGDDVYRRLAALTERVLAHADEGREGTSARRRPERLMGLSESDVERLPANVVDILVRNEERSASPFQKIARSIDALPSQGRSLDEISALSSISFICTCIVYGFTGRLWGPENASDRKMVLEAAASFLRRTMSAVQMAPVDLSPGAAKQVPTENKTRKRRLSSGLWVAAPVLFTLIWYVICSGIVAGIPMP